MIAKESEGGRSRRSRVQRILPWLSLVISLLLVAAGLWYLAKTVSLAEVGRVLRQARLPYIALSLAIIVTTLGLKAWRWQTLLSPGGPRLSFPALFWAMMLGQYVNILVPILRLGELARVYELNRLTKIGKVRGLSTLVLEKSLELVMLGTTVAVLISTAVLPELIGESTLVLGLAAMVGLALLYVIAYEAERLVHWIQRLSSTLPQAIGRQISRFVLSGLEGLASLRDRRRVLILFAQSLAIAFMALLTPWLLFFALELPFGLAEAAILHVAVTLAVVPPSTPGKLVVFDATVAFLLVQFGLKEAALVAGYTLIYHLVALLPQIVFGGIAATRANWRWQQHWRADQGNGETGTR